MLHGKKVKLVPLEKEDLPKSLPWVNNSDLNSKMLRVLPVTQLDQEKWYQDIVSDSAKRFASSYTERVLIGSTFPQYVSIWGCSSGSP